MMARVRRLGVIGRPSDWMVATTVVKVRWALTQSMIASSSLNNCTPCAARAWGSHLIHSHRAAPAGDANTTTAKSEGLCATHACNTSARAAALA